MLPCNREFPASKLQIPHRGALLELRPFKLTDVPKIVEAIEESLPVLKPFLAWAHLPQTVEVQLKRVRSMLSPVANGEDFGFGLFDVNTQRFLGGCGLHPWVPLNPFGVEIGFWTRATEGNKGLATLMTQLLLVYSFEALGMERVQIAHNVENIGSKRVIEKCGFVFEGVRRDAQPPRDKKMLDNGLTPCRDTANYALLPKDQAQLNWYTQLRDKIQVFDQLEDDLGTLWKRETEISTL